MHQLVDLLDPESDQYSLPHALVHLWVLARNQVLLNQWEQKENETSVSVQRRVFDEAFDRERAIPLSSIESAPLALTRALDDHLALVRSDSSLSTRKTDEFLYSVDARDFWLVSVPLAARRMAHTTMQAQRHSRWFHHHAVLPRTTGHGIDVEVHLSRSQLDGRLHAMVKKPDTKLRVWIAHFCDEADVCWDQKLSPVGNWRTLKVSPNESRITSVENTLHEAMRAGAHVVVFPEFTLDLRQREVVRKRLIAQCMDDCCPILVVAGSFHGPVDTTASQSTFNTAPVYACGGRLLFSHCKLRLFGDEIHGAEHADVGSHLHVLVPPIGCMTVLICKDFFDDDTSVSGLLTEVPLDWVWVPSFGNKTTLKLHKKKAKELARVTPGTSVAVAQTRNSALEPQCENLPGFGHAAGCDKPNDVNETGGFVDFPLSGQGVPARRPPRLRAVK